jgi:hypothetical protein
VPPIDCNQAAHVQLSPVHVKSVAIADQNGDEPLTNLHTYEREPDLMNPGMQWAVHSVRSTTVPPSTVQPLSGIHVVFGGRAGRALTLQGGAAGAEGRQTQVVMVVH